jgi:EpsI family protein
VTGGGAALLRERFDRRGLLIGGAFLATAGLAAARLPRRRENRLGSAELEKLVPPRFDGWSFQTASGLVLPPQDQLSDSVYSQLLTRVYSRGDASVMLLIAYSASQDGTIQAHRPEACYPASGYTLVQNVPQDVRLAPGVSVPSRYIVADGRMRKEHVLYWTRAGRHFPTRWVDQRIAVAEENIAGVIPDGVLLRVSTVVQENPVALLHGFAGALFSSLGPRMTSVLIG